MNSCKSFLHKTPLSECARPIMVRLSADRKMCLYVVRLFSLCFCYEFWVIQGKPSLPPACTVLQCPAWISWTGAVVVPFVTHSWCPFYLHTILVLAQAQVTLFPMSFSLNVCNSLGEFQVLVVNNPFLHQRLQAKLIQLIPVASAGGLLMSLLLCKYLNINVWMCEYGVIK